MIDNKKACENSKNALSFNIFNMKKIIMIGASVGLFGGSYIPLLWDSGIFSFSSIIFGTLGGFLGVWVGYKIAMRFGA